MELDVSQVLGEHVSRVVIAVDEEDFDVSLCYDLPDVVVPNINMLGSSLSHRV